MGNKNTASSSRNRRSESHRLVIHDYVSGVKAINSSLYSNSCRSLNNKELFQVPRLQQHCSSDKNELVAVFIAFLVQLLDYETECMVSYQDQIFCLKKELRFLVAILGDTPFQGKLKGLEKVLAEFEAVANEAGSLVRSFIFTSKEPFKSRKKGKAALRVLLQHIKLLNANIIRFSESLPNNVKQKTCAVESTFIVDSLVLDLEGLVNREDIRIADVKDQIKVLHQGLTLSRSLLKDMKLPPYLEIEELKELVMRTRDVAYEAEYLINTFLVGDAPLWYLTTRLPHIILKIELIGTGLQEIRKNYDSGALQAAKYLSAQLSLQPKRNPDVDEIIVGFEEEEKNMLSQLVGGTKHLQVISIFGMPGLGKTTFAKKLYNNPSVKYYFDKCSWCVVSQTYRRKSLLIDILVDLGNEFDKVRMMNMDEESLAESLYKSLKGRRYIIVMDDIWNSNLWNDFHRYFPDDGNGSRILFTSRNKDVAPPRSIIYALPPLSNDQCWELLGRKLFHNEACPPQLLGIGKEIAESCNGLPLAVVVIAGILSAMKKEISVWTTVGRSLASRILSDKNNAVVQILKLSYKHLPEHLKPCFLYFGAFPEDEEVCAKKLKWLWITEGFIRKEENKSIESVAEEYLVELINKSLLIVTKRRSDGGAKACVVHDLLRDLCLRIAEEESFLKVTYNSFPLYEKQPRLYVCINDTFAGVVRFGRFGLNIRCMFGYLPDTSLCISNMKLLRVLDFPMHILKLNYGGEIKLLVHLRYLAVSSVPPSVGNLVNLEVLIVTDGKIHLFWAIRKMVKLRYLSARTAVIDTDCNTSQTSTLEYLSTVDIETPQGEEMLKSCSPHLRKLKCRCRPFWDEQMGESRYPDLRILTQLESLHMEAYNYTLTWPRGLQVYLPSNIRKLTLFGLWLPWEKMFEIGELPNLQVLKLSRSAFVGEIWETRDGQFQQLRYLKLNQLGIAQWNVASSEHFPKLQQLVLRTCYNLQEIPSEIGEIATLLFIEVERCSEAVAESARKIQEEQVDMGNEELRVIIGNIYTGVDCKFYNDIPSSFNSATY